MKVVVLGCGPAGLMSAHAARMAGHHVVIMSRKVQSPLFGAQYLHEPIPGVTEEESYVDLDYQVYGDVEMYRRKVYGPKWDGTVSPEDYAGKHRAWDIRETYDRLWQMYEANILDLEIDPAGIGQLVGSGKFDLVVNTIPMDILCTRGHTFGYTTIVAAGDAPELGIDVGLHYQCPQNTVICNGEEVPSWYRMSRIFGYTTVEWPEGINPPIPTASTVRKPTFTNCDCWPELLRVGRYGKWEKGVLTHDAYNTVTESLYATRA